MCKSETEIEKLLEAIEFKLMQNTNYLIRKNEEEKLFVAEV